MFQNIVFAVALFATIAMSNIGITDARMRISRMRTSRCDCASTVSKERDEAYNKYNTAISISENIITINNCPPGKEFKYDDYSDDYKVNCNNCPDNYYRTSTNASCLHCPVGYYSKSGDAECTKAKTNSSNVHTFCGEGSISGNNKFAEYKESCYSCYAENKEYMPYKNNHDSCFICPKGSIVDRAAKSCTECPAGYYEKDNICIECDIGTYNDKLGASKCNVCNNQNAIAYNSVGGYNCDNSIFYDLTDTIKNNLINMDMVLKPLAYSANLGVAMISNNRRAAEIVIPGIAITYFAIISM
jgi:hypothetical protein